MSPTCKYCSGYDLNYYSNVEYWGGVGNLGEGWLHGNRIPGGGDTYCENQEYWDANLKNTEATDGGERSSKS